jgi:prophage tail gpP-like protein
LCAPFGVSVVAPSSTGAVIDIFKIQQGETVFEALDRAAKKRGYLLTTDGLGSLVITRPGTQRATTRLEQGINILSGSAVFDFKNRFSKYTVKGQDFGWNKEVDPAFAYKTIATATDPSVKRHRPLVIQSEQLTNLNDAKQRVNWEASVRAARASKFNIVVQGWRQGDGSLWRPNQLVLCRADRIGLNGEMLITDVSYTLGSDTGSTTTLALERKDAYAPEPEVPEKSDPLVQAIKKDPGFRRGPQ